MIKANTAPARESAGLRRYTDTLAPYALALLRILVGITFLLHGLPKFQNLAGFSGFVGSLGIPLPGVVGPLIALLEVGGGLLLIAGVATRWVSLLFVIEMIITTLLVKSQLGFIAPPGAPNAGAELDLLLMAGALVLLCYGPGQLSVERNVLKREL
jgi:putative oxidoreductase